MSTEQRMDVIILGRKLGTASGWDGELESLTFYDFQPEKGVELCPGCLSLSLESAMLEILADDGSVLSMADAMSVLSGLPLAAPKV